MAFSALKLPVVEPQELSLLVLQRSSFMLPPHSCQDKFSTQHERMFQGAKEEAK